MSFVAILTQAAEGCDYTIGCGVKVVPMTATTWEAAMDEARWTLARANQGDSELGSLEILEVVQRVEAPVEEWYEGFRAAKQRDADEDGRDGRRALYESLKAEFDPY
jgi:hypothetical protein